MNSTHRQDGAELQLMDGIAAGDQSAFERLYGLYEKRVYQYVCTLIFDSALAEEVVGDTMLAVWRGAKSFARTSRLSTWIFGIARHKAMDALRHTSKHQREVNLDGALTIPDHQHSPSETVQQTQVGELTQQALATLSREHQEILRLAFFEELPYEEISVLLSIPTNTVKTRVYYAKQRLKDCLESLGQKESI